MVLVKILNYSFVIVMVMFLTISTANAQSNGDGVNGGDTGGTGQDWTWGGLIHEILTSRPGPGGVHPDHPHPAS